MVKLTCQTNLRLRPFNLEASPLPPSPQVNENHPRGYMENLIWRCLLSFCRRWNPSGSRIIKTCQSTSPPPLSPSNHLIQLPPSPLVKTLPRFCPRIGVPWSSSSLGGKMWHRPIESRGRCCMVRGWKNVFHFVHFTRFIHMHIGKCLYLHRTHTPNTQTI